MTRLYRKLELVPALDRAIWVLRYLEGEALDDIARCAAAPSRRCNAGCAPWMSTTLVEGES